MEGWLILIGITALITFLAWLIDTFNKAKKYEELKPELDNLDRYKEELESREAELKKEQKKWKEKVQSDTKAINTLAKEKSLGFPWLAQAYADYFYLQKLKEADHLERKSHPAPVAAAKVREIARERRIIEKNYALLKESLNIIKTYFLF
jgi:FtsZ-binding cell division protein ZapB